MPPKLLRIDAVPASYLPFVGHSVMLFDQNVPDPSTLGVFALPFLSFSHSRCRPPMLQFVSFFFSFFFFFLDAPLSPAEGFSFSPLVFPFFQLFSSTWDCRFPRALTSLFMRMPTVRFPVFLFPKPGSLHCGLLTPRLSWIGPSRLS